MTHTAIRAVERPPDQVAPAGGLAPRPERRRQLRWAAGALTLAVSCALAFALLLQAAGQREPVLVVARAVAAGALIAAEDLTVARVSVDPALRPLAAARQAQVVGARAAFPLPAGTLLTQAHLDPGGVLPSGRAVVGVAVPLADLPASTLKSGDRVVVVLTSGGDSAEGVDGHVLGSGEVFAIEATDEATGTMRVSLLLPEAVAVDVAAAAAADRVRLIWVGGA